MAIAINFLDTINKRVYLDTDAGSITTRTVQQIGSLIKQELKKSTYVPIDQFFSWSGFDDLPGGNKVGIVMVMKDGWDLWTLDQGSPHRFQITEGIILEEGGGDPLGSPVNIVWSLAEYTVSSILGAADVTDIQDIRRFLGIGVKRLITTDGSKKLRITEEDKTTVVQQYSVDDENAPTEQTDDDI